MRHKLNDPTWKQWRDENPESVAAMIEKEKTAMDFASTNRRLRLRKTR
jgi:hypothetical protein